jgi:hypothetical protein
MRESLAPRDASVSLAPGKPEPPFTIAAAPVMNAQALLDDIRKFNARQARVERAAAAERERMNQAITACLIALCHSIATTERASA